MRPSAAGKGDDRRPAQVPPEEVARRWKRTFGEPARSEDTSPAFVCGACSTRIKIDDAGRGVCPACNIPYELPE